MNVDKILYKTTATATGGRDGHAKTADGGFDVKLATPKELGGAGGAGANPEQLFAAGYSACFIGALKFVAGKRKVALPAETAVDATVAIGPKGPGFGLEVDLAVKLPGIDPDTARALVDDAHQVCPYSNATRDNIPVRLQLQ